MRSPQAKCKFVSSNWLDYIQALEEVREISE